MATEKRQDLINRQDLIKAVESKHFAIADNTHPYEAIRIQGKYFREVVDNAPKVDAVEVVHGRWVNPYMNRYGHPCHCCSVCGFKASYQDKNYCPNCGAKMDGDGND